MSTQKALKLIVVLVLGRQGCNFFAQTPRDPGRRELRNEFTGEGDERLRLPLSCGGCLSVRGFPASEQQVPQGWPSGSFQEWRSLTFEPAAKQDAGPPFIQSVSKVTCCPDGRWLPEADPQVLALNYPKTLSAAVAAALRVLEIPQPTILVIGLGSGAVPLWLAEVLPESQVDVVELEGTVIRAAAEVLGFPILVEDAGERNRSPLRQKFLHRLRAIEGDGALLAEQWATAKTKRYDAVLIDAYDSLNRVPEPLWADEGPLASSLPQLLKSTGVLAANVPPGFPTETMVQNFRRSLDGTEEVRALTFEVPETMNTVALVLRGVQAQPLHLMRKEARKMVDGQQCLIDAVGRLTDCVTTEM